LMQRLFRRLYPDPPCGAFAAARIGEFKKQQTARSCRRWCLSCRRTRNQHLSWWCLRWLLCNPS
jgi:hypothetical protein